MVGRFRLFSIVSAVCVGASVAWDALLSAIAYLLDVAATPMRYLLPSFEMANAPGPAPAYEAPASHFLRHEAGVSRRSAARHV
jgi:hypothetical protein